MPRPEGHAPGLEENFPEVTILICPRCHNGPGGLTARAYDTGQIRDHNRKRPHPPRPQHERVWSLVQGSSDLIAMSQRSIGSSFGIPDMEERARTIEQLGGAFNRFMWLLESTAAGTPVAPLGPEPAKNLRRRRRRPRWATRRPPPTETGAAACSLRRVLPLIGYMAKYSRTMGALMAGDNACLIAAAQDRSTAMLEEVLSHPVTTLRALLRLERSGSMDEILEAMDPALSAGRWGVPLLMTAPDEQYAYEVLIRMVRVFAPLERATVRLLTELSRGEDPMLGVRTFLREVELFR